ncbi:hypothetical protein EDB85DRAFT_1894356 [Lactarius pseudohatsudake]|nr:hypothetical protein EDB85DRAFT_1894356 [Lactarius pseudohatsudake]
MTIVCRWSSGPDSENGYMRPKTTAAENKSSADESTKVETDGTKTEGDSGSWQNGVETVVEDGARGEREGTVGEAVDRDGVVDAESDIDTVPVGDGGSADTEAGIDTVGVREGEGGDESRWSDPDGPFYERWGRNWDWLLNRLEDSLNFLVNGLCDGLHGFLNRLRGNNANGPYEVKGVVRDGARREWSEERYITVKKVPTDGMDKDNAENDETKGRPRCSPQGSCRRLLDAIFSTHAEVVARHSRFSPAMIFYAFCLFRLVLLPASDARIQYIEDTLSDNARRLRRSVVRVIHPGPSILSTRE